MSEFWIHLAATKQISQRLRSKSHVGSRSERLINIASFLTIISDTTDLNLEPIPWVQQTSTLKDVVFGDGHGLDFTYGITATLANFIHRTTQLARHICFYLLPGDSPPIELTSAAEDLWNEILSWDITQENLEVFSDCDSVTVLIATKHMLAFAQSIRIYFYTRVLPCPPSEMTSCIRAVAEILGEIERIKERTGYNTVLTATITWPGFIASCEAEPDSREAWSSWWTSMLDYRIGNINDLWTVGKEAWSSRDQGVNETPGWAPILRRDGKRILAI